MQDALGLGTLWLAAVGILAAIGLWLLVTGLRRFFRGRLVRGSMRSAFGAAIGAMAVAIAAVGMNLYTYHRLDFERPVATIEFQQLGPQHFQALLRTPDGRDRAFEMRGDEWQLDARVLKWKGVGTLLGLDPHYRLERFSGRYRTVGDEHHATRTIYGLGGEEKGIDVWELSREHERWVPFVDTIYGSAAYMPMRDGLTFQVMLTEDGLIARQRSGTGS